MEFQGSGYSLAYNQRRSVRQKRLAAAVAACGNRQSKQCLVRNEGKG